MRLNNLDIEIKHKQATLFYNEVMDVRTGYELDEALWVWYQANPDEIPFFEPDWDGMRRKPSGTLLPATYRGGRKYKCECSETKICTNCSSRRSDYLKTIKVLRSQSRKNANVL